jgi:hypothetical protein
MQLAAAEIIQYIKPKDVTSPTEREAALKSKFLSLFPEQANNVASYITNPNCSCKSALISSLNDNPSKATQMISAIAGEGEQPTFVVVGDPNKLEGAISIAGQVAIIPASPEQYKLLINQLARDNKTYKGLTVKDGPAGNFMVFFF